MIASGDIRIGPAIRGILAVLALLPSLAWGAPSGEDLLEALRAGNAPLVERLVEAGAPVNALDEFGSSAVMYAAIYCDAPVLRLLLDRGANPNHVNIAGATALMWAIPDRAKHLAALH